MKGPAQCGEYWSILNALRSHKKRDGQEECLSQGVKYSLNTEYLVLSVDQ